MDDVPFTSEQVKLMESYSEGPFKLEIDRQEQNDAMLSTLFLDGLVVAPTSQVPDTLFFHGQDTFFEEDGYAMRHEMPSAAIYPTEIIDPIQNDTVIGDIVDKRDGRIIGDQRNSQQIVVDEWSGSNEVVQAGTKVTKTTNLKVIRRRKMNVHKYKKRRRKLRKNTRLHMSRRRRNRPAILKQLEEINDLKNYFAQKELDKLRKKHKEE